MAGPARLISDRTTLSAQFRPSRLPLNQAVDTLAGHVERIARRVEQLEVLEKRVFVPGCSLEGVEVSVFRIREIRRDISEQLRPLAASAHCLFHSMKARYNAAEEPTRPPPLRERNVITLGDDSPGDKRALRDVLLRLDRLRRQLRTSSQVTKKRPFIAWRSGCSFLERRRTISPTPGNPHLPDEAFKVASFLATGNPLPFGRRLGVGSFGTVRRCRIADSAIAVKLFKPEIGRGGGSSSEASLDFDGAAEAGARAVRESPEGKREREAHMHALASRLPGVLPILGILDESLLLPLAERGTLSDLLKRGESVSMEQLRALVSTFAQLHDMGMVHRDIKTANVVVMGDGSLKVIDFGYALMVGPREHLPATAKHVGTLYTMAPEVCRCKAYDPRKADVWSLGVVLYRMATGGRHPHQLSGSDHVKGAIAYMLDVAQAKVEPNFELIKDRRLRHLVSLMLHRDPSQRPSMALVLEHPYFAPAS